jgi:hypothetical protein
VTIGAGNNDLSVTLLPMLSVGPAGPKGDKGDKGDQGAQAPTGLRRRAQTGLASTTSTATSTAGTVP